MSVSKGKSVTVPRDAKITEEQKRILIECVKNPAIISGKYKLTQLDGKNIWFSIANILNSMQGAEKEWDGWRKTWQDLRSHTKIKAEGNKKKANETGGGPSNSQDDPLSEMEEEIVEIVKKVSIEGRGANESSTSFDFTH